MPSLQAEPAVKSRADDAWQRWCARTSVKTLRGEADAIECAMSALLSECPHPEFRDERGGGSRCPDCREQAAMLRAFYGDRLCGVEAELARRRRAA